MVQNKTEPGRPRGRPRSFEPDEALQRVLRTFWSKGYSATTLDDLSAATGLNRPSLYAAFGNKRALYEAALSNYWERSYQALKSALAGDDPLEAALLRVYEGALQFYIPPQGPSLGCFAVSTAVTEAVDDPGIRDALATGLRKLDRDFEARIRQAQSVGDISASADCAALAMLASATLHSLGIRARSGETREVLWQFAQRAVQLICRA